MCKPWTHGTDARSCDTATCRLGESRLRTLPTQLWCCNLKTYMNVQSVIWWRCLQAFQTFLQGQKGTYQEKYDINHWNVVHKMIYSRKRWVICRILRVYNYSQQLYHWNVKTIYTKILNIVFLALVFYWGNIWFFTRIVVLIMLKDVINTVICWFFLILVELLYRIISLHSFILISS